MTTRAGEGQGGEGVLASQVLAAGRLLATGRDPADPVDAPVWRREETADAQANQALLPRDLCRLLDVKGTRSAGVYPWWTWSWRTGRETVPSVHPAPEQLPLSMPAQDAEVLAPGPHGLAVAVGHDADDLADVCEVVHRPGGQELLQGHWIQSRMRSLAGQVGGLQPELMERSQVLAPALGEEVQELPG